MKRLFYPALALMAALAPAAPAAAEPAPDECVYVYGPYPAGPEIDLDNDGNPEATLPNPTAHACAGADSGLPDPARFTCYGGMHDCDLRVTTGHGGSASAGTEACVDPLGNGSGPLCVTGNTGAIPVLPVEENTICIGWSLHTSCMYD